MRIAIGADEVTPLARAMVAALGDMAHEVDVVGPLAGGEQEWAEVSAEVARRVGERSADRGVVMCWSGTGASIAANKVPGARAALCADAETARMARLYNHANVLALSMRAISEPIGREILDAFLAGPDGTEAFDLRNVARLEAPGASAPSRVAPVVLVHGLIGSLDMPELRRGLAPRQVIAPPLLGYGSAGEPAYAFDLDTQVKHVLGVIDAVGAPRVHLVGHSVGGAVAALLADRHPDRVASLTSVEGNFTLVDGFWSAEVAGMSPDEVEQMLAGYRADPEGWLRSADVEPDERRLALARRWLDCQPAATLHAQAAAVVRSTAAPEYLQALRRVFEQTPVFLMAGERSRGGWDVPEWAVRRARDAVFMPGVGHLMMLEQPERFTKTLDGLLTRAESGQ